MTYLELLAPAKDKNIGIAAIACGADAVYIAAERFGARAAAGNSLEDIAQLCEYAHKFGARVFVTVNTIFYDSESQIVAELLRGIQAAGADAVIIQDMGVLQMILERKISLDIPLHASTQCAIRTPERARELAAAGFSRLILERQLPLEAIREITAAVPECEIECFVHGALCVGYSGQCYLSERLCERSANRGVCAQACRSRYDLVDGDGAVVARNRTLLSVKDYCLLEHVEAMADAGVCSFKIEGRLKGEDYVKNVVGAYRAEIDRVIASRPSEYGRASFGSSSLPFEPSLEKTFNRGYTSFLFDPSFRSVSQLAQGGGELVGSVKYVAGNRQGCTLTFNKMLVQLNNGDGLCFVSRSGETVGFRADKVLGDKILCKALPEMFAGARIFRNSDIVFEKALERPVERLLDVSVKVKLQQGSLDVEALREDGAAARRSYDVRGFDAAMNRERVLGLVQSGLSKKTEIFKFQVDSLESDSEAAMPLLSSAYINNIRRELADELLTVPVRSRAMVCRSVAACKGASAPSAAPLSPSSSLEASGQKAYKLNVSNLLSARFYGTGLDAYELHHQGGAELLRTRHCIRREMGACLKEHPEKLKAPLSLRNNGRNLALQFDCAACEMIVKG